MWKNICFPLKWLWCHCSISTAASFLLPSLTSSCTSGLARTIPIWELTKGQPFDTDSATWAADWANSLLWSRVGSCLVFGVPEETPSLASREAGPLTLICRAMMGHRSARDIKVAPVLLKAGFGAAFKKGQWWRKAAIALQLFLVWDKMNMKWRIYFVLWNVPYFCKECGFYSCQDVPNAFLLL